MRRAAWTLLCLGLLSIECVLCQGICPASMTSLSGSMSVAACECAANTYFDNTNVRDDRAIALKPESTVFSTIARRSLAASTSTATFNATVGPPGGRGAVVFKRFGRLPNGNVGLLHQNINGGSHTFNVATGGFTAIAVVRFTGMATISGNENIFDFGTQTQVISRTDGPILARHSHDRMMFLFVTGVGECEVFCLGLIPDMWMTIVATYVHSTNTLGLKVGSQSATFVCTPSSAPSNRVAISSIIGDRVTNSKGHVGLLTGDLAGLYVVDAVLSSAQITAITARMYLGQDPLLACITCPSSWTSPQGSIAQEDCVPPCPSNSQRTADGLACECSAGYSGLPESCLICPKGWFKIFPGSAACEEIQIHTTASSSVGFAGARILQCPPGHVSPADSTSLADCVCAPGFFKVASTCEPCAADSYKTTAGNAACTPCGAGKRSLPGAAAEDECLCDAGFTGTACSACARQIGRASCRERV